MNDKKWETFFELLGEIINLPNMSAGEKMAEVERRAEEYSSAGDLEEFACWFAE